MALLGQFRQAKNITGSFDETAGYRSCRSPLELCFMWSLRVTNFGQQARRRSGWRVARGVDQKCQNTENNVYQMHYTVKSWNELLSANTNKLKSLNSSCHRAKLACVQTSPISFVARAKRDVCVTPSLIMLQRPAGFPRSWKHAVIGWHTVRIVWLNADWLLSNLVW